MGSLGHRREDAERARARSAAAWRSACAVDDGGRRPSLARSRTPVDGSGEGGRSDGRAAGRHEEAERQAARTALSAIAARSCSELEPAFGGRRDRGAVACGRARRDHHGRTRSGSPRRPLRDERASEEEDDEMDREQDERERTSRRACWGRCSAAASHPEGDSTRITTACAAWRARRSSLRFATRAWRVRDVTRGYDGLRAARYALMVVASSSVSSSRVSPTPAHSSPTRMQ